MPTKAKPQLKTASKVASKAASQTATKAVSKTAKKVVPAKSASAKSAPAKTPAVKAPVVKTPVAKKVAKTAPVQKPATPAATPAAKSVAKSMAKTAKAKAAGDTKTTLRGRSVFVVQTTSKGVVVRSAWLSEDKKLMEMPAVFPEVNYALAVIDDLRKQVLDHFSRAAQVGARAIASQRKAAAQKS